MNKAAPFLITGYPRSRTAWLANFLSFGTESFCHHDALRQCRTPDDMVALFEQCPASIVGDSDSGLMFFFKRIDELFPEARWVFVQRNWQEAMDSYIAFDPRMDAGMVRAVFRNLRHLAEWMLEHVPAERTLFVKFADLEKRETVQRLWEFCLPTVAWQEARWRLLDQMRVNVILDKAERDNDPDNLKSLAKAKLWA